MPSPADRDRGDVTTVHGGLEAAELRSLGLDPAQLLDFSSNINPLGPSPRIRRAAANADLAAYPDRTSLMLREALGDRLGVATESILIGNGSTELIHLLARARLRPGVGCLILTPTFGEYRAAAEMAGGAVEEVRATRGQMFRWSPTATARAIERVRPGLVFLCNPNNPTGVYLDRDHVTGILQAAGEESLVVLDDAYASLADHPWDPLQLFDRGNLAVLRSMTKDHALAGVRLGYLVARPDVVAEAWRLQPAWSVNALAQAVGLAALEDDEHLEKARQTISDAKSYLYAALRDLGMESTPSAANFVLVRVGNAAEMRRALMLRGVVVRDCASFGLPDHIRIAVRRRHECVRLVDELRGMLKAGG